MSFFFNSSIWCGILFKVFIEFVTILLPFYVLLFGCKACGILATWLGIECISTALEGKDLTTGLPGKSPKIFHLFGLVTCTTSFSTGTLILHMTFTSLSRRNSKEVGVDFSDILNIDLMYLFNTYFLSTHDVPRRTQEINYIAKIMPEAKPHVNKDLKRWEMR